jgi:hypothetical protein
MRQHADDHGRRKIRMLATMIYFAEFQHADDPTVAGRRQSGVTCSGVTLFQHADDPTVAGSEHTASRHKVSGSNT